MKTSIVAGFLAMLTVLAALAGPTNAPPLPARSLPTMGGVARNPERQPSPRFAGRRLPVPPRQNSPWSPPLAALPTNYVSATTILFEAGMADPRACDYRAIEVGTGSVWNGDGGVVKTHGWVLPGGGTQSFAVCWNGLVYPTGTVGKQADWRADARAAIQHTEFQWRGALPEAQTIAYDTCQPLEGCLLLRLTHQLCARDSHHARPRRPLP
jgi:hypothetical protein